MNILLLTIGYLVSLPARIKGVKFGKNSYIAFGYDFMLEQLKNIKIGDNCRIGKNAWVHTVQDGAISVGDNTMIGRRITISASNKVKIGKDCLISYDVSILDHDHDYKNITISPLRAKLTHGTGVEISERCFMGAHSFILKNVSLGKHCIVGANSVVTKSFPAYSVIAGNPAKLIHCLKGKELKKKQQIDKRED